MLVHGHIVKMQYFFSSSCLHLGINQTNLVCSNDDKGSTNIVNFMTRGAGVFKLRRGHVHDSHYEYVLSFYSYNIQNIDCFCIRGL